MEQTKYDVFISYSRKDYVDSTGNIIPNNMLSRIMESFDSEGISYWFDEDGIYSGDEFASILTKAIRNSTIFLFISSVNSNHSKWTSNEISTALVFGKTIIPFRLDDSPYNDSVMMKIVSFDYIEGKNGAKAINKLLKAVKHHLTEAFDRSHWRETEVPKGARGTIVAFEVEGEWEEHSFSCDEENNRRKMTSPLQRYRVLSTHKSRGLSSDFQRILSTPIIRYSLIGFLILFVGILIAVFVARSSKATRSEMEIANAIQARQNSIDNIAKALSDQAIVIVNDAYYYRQSNPDDWFDVANNIEGEYFKALQSIDDAVNNHDVSEQCRNDLKEIRKGITDSLQIIYDEFEKRADLFRGDDESIVQGFEERMHEIEPYLSQTY